MNNTAIFFVEQYAFFSFSNKIRNFAGGGNTIMPIKTLGLTHISLKVKDTERSLKFYEKVFGVKVMYHEEGFVQVQTPGSKDIIVFEKGDSQNGKSGGIKHFGFRLQHANDMEAAAEIITGSGGIIIEKGEFVPGEPYIFFKDPDGYEVELWYELLPE